MAESLYLQKQREALQRRRAVLAFVLGLPAVTVALASVACLTQAVTKQQGGELRHHYLKAAQVAVDAEDWQAAEMLSRKVVHLRSGDPAGLYLVALCADGNGDVARARRLMKPLAPADRPGYAPAQWWVVRDIAMRAHPMTVEQAHSFRDHLTQFLATYDRHPEALMLLGQAELALGNVEAALDQMGHAAEAEPAYRLTLARVAARLGRATAARSHAERACRVCQQRLREAPEDVPSRLQWVDGLTMMGRLEEAGDRLLEGLALDNDPLLRAGLVQLSITTFDLLDRQEVRNADVFGHQLALIQRSLSLAPDHRPLLKRLAQLSVDPLDEQGLAAALLQPWLDAERAPAVVHMVLGNAALEREDYATALAHLEAAHREQPDYGVCLNNLAWALVHVDESRDDESRPQPDDLDRALKLVDRAIALEPERIEFRETRGQILVRREQLSKSSPDMQHGPVLPGQITQTRAVFAEGDASGVTESAAYHRELD